MKCLSAWPRKHREASSSLSPVVNLTHSKCHLFTQWLRSDPLLIPRQRDGGSPARISGAGIQDAEFQSPPHRSGKHGDRKTRLISSTTSPARGRDKSRQCSRQLPSPRNRITDITGERAPASAGQLGRAREWTLNCAACARPTRNIPAERDTCGTGVSVNVPSARELADVYPGACVGYFGSLGDIPRDTRETFRFIWLGVIT
jgi:hypothetical protein